MVKRIAMKSLIDVKCNKKKVWNSINNRLKKPAKNPEYSDFNNPTPEINLKEIS